MKSLREKQKELKNLIPIGIDIALKTFKQYLPSTSVKFNDLIELAARYQENHKKLLRGTISNEAAILEANRIREALLELIDNLEEKDFQEVVATKSSKKGHRKGKILYRVPDVMQVNVSTTCIVRIAFDEETLTYDISLQVGDEIKELRRVSEVMSVELIDPTDYQPFKIKSFSEPVQFVEEDDYTEWQYFVTPVMAVGGRFFFVDYEFKRGTLTCIKKELTGFFTS